MADIVVILFFMFVCGIVMGAIALFLIYDIKTELKYRNTLLEEQNKILKSK